MDALVFTYWITQSIYFLRLVFTEQIVLVNPYSSIQPTYSMFHTYKGGSRKAPCHCDGQSSTPKFVNAPDSFIVFREIQFLTFAFYRDWPDQSKESYAPTVAKGGSSGMFCRVPNDVWGGPNVFLRGQTVQRSWFFQCNAMDVMLKLLMVWEGPNHGVVFGRDHDPLSLLDPPIHCPPPPCILLWTSVSF